MIKPNGKLKISIIKATSIKMAKSVLKLRNPGCKVIDVQPTECSGWGF